MAEWQDISRKLSATPGVEELDVAGLSARGARVTLRYAGGAERLAEELARQGLSLRNARRQLGAVPAIDAARHRGSTLAPSGG